MFDITQRLQTVFSESGGADQAELADVFDLVYDELRQLASRQLRGQPSRSATLVTTALVHECYLRLAGVRGLEVNGRAQFFALASKAMRHLIIDHARARRAEKRGGGQVSVTLTEGTAASKERTVDLIILNDALERLGDLDDRLERVVECRFFGGMTGEETARALDVSQRTVERDWRRARTYLLELLEEPG